MTLRELKSILAEHLDGAGAHFCQANSEVIEQIMPGKENYEVPFTTIAAFWVDGTTVFLSDSGLTRPDRMVFLDLKSGNSFVQNVED